MPSKLQGKLPVIVINFATATSDIGRGIWLPKDRCSVPFQDVILPYVISVRLMSCLINLMALTIILEV